MTQKTMLIGLIAVFLLLVSCTANRPTVQLSAAERKTALDKLQMTDGDVRKLLEKRREKDVDGWYTEGVRKERDQPASLVCPEPICSKDCCLVCIPNPGGGCACYYVGC